MVAEHFRVCFFHEAFALHVVIHGMSAIGLSMLARDFHVVPTTIVCWLRVLGRIAVHYKVNDLRRAYTMGVANFLCTSVLALCMMFFLMPEPPSGAIITQGHIAYTSLAYAMSGLAIGSYAMAPSIEMAVVAGQNMYQCWMLGERLHLETVQTTLHFVGFFIGLGCAQMHRQNRWEQYVRHIDLQARSRELMLEKQMLDSERRRLHTRAEQLEQLLDEQRNRQSTRGPGVASSRQEGGGGARGGGARGGRGGRSPGRSGHALRSGTNSELRNRRSPARRTSSVVSRGETTRSRLSDFTSVTGDSGSSIGFAPPVEWDDNDSQI